MGFLSDVFDFENVKLGNMWDKYKQNPERIFLGINTPFESKLWGGLLGKDYSPTIDMYGGATSDDVEKAREKGVNTGPGESMHGLARFITSIYAGGAAGKALGAGGGAASSGSSTGGGLNGGLIGETASSNGTGLTYGGGMGTQGGLSAMGEYGSGVSGSIPQAGAAASPSMFSQGMNYLNAGSKAINAANTAKQMFSQPERPIQPSPFTPAMPNNTLGQMVSSINQQQQTADQLEQQRRLARRNMIRGLL